ncbi:DNA polymerase III subunit delta' [Desulfonema ishimotonii]|uniref:DNA polymerase III subunit delta' n=1 Tax=Desulfonema ishimotonii TaxID=45657 RepID=A0A401FQV4_9BACT|nr:DNA polymerase III subunit delta' [Desulfonema ishimotonii]GBC59340.1 DNA polymerase III subunit delta' [Desulfonema ishimotonii]
MSESDLRYLQGQKALNNLSAILCRGKIPHALLFTGIGGIGKCAAALAFAMACNCSRSAERSDLSGLFFSDPCTCRSCQKIRSGNHPDIHRVDPSGPFIKIDQIRDLCHALSMKPYEAEMRVVIITQAQTMNPEAANALLKMLEEPPDRTVLILTATQTSDLLPTIVSRCQTIRFAPIPRQTVVRFFVEQHGIPEADAAVLATLSGGSPERFRSATAIRKYREQIRWRAWLIGICNELILTAGAQRFAGTALAFAERLSGNRETLSDALDLIRIWLRDLVICKYHPDKIINRDLAETVRSVSEKLTVPSLLSKISAIQSAQKGLRSNANPRLTAEVLMLRLTKTDV